MLRNELVWMVIAVYLPSCLSQLSSGSVAKIWQSVSVHAERGSKLDGNYGPGFLGWHPKKHGIRWFESENGNGARHGHSRSLSGSVVVNSQFTPPPSQHLPLRQTPFFFLLLAFLSLFLADLRYGFQNLCNERRIFSLETLKTSLWISHSAWCLFISITALIQAYTWSKMNTHSLWWI